MKYVLPNKKVVNIPDEEITKSIQYLQISKDEAVQLWLEDNDYFENEEQQELETKAKKVKIQHGAATGDRKKPAKPRTVKISDEKKELFETIIQNLDRCEGVLKENIQILKENKLIQVKIGSRTFKIDVIEQRQPKKS